MLLDFETSSRDKNGLWLVFPPQDNKRYFVPEDSIAALLPEKGNISIILRKKVDDIERFRIEQSDIGTVAKALTAENFIPVTTTAGSNNSEETPVTSWLAKKAIVGAREENGQIVLINTRDVLFDDIYGEGKGQHCFPVIDPQNELRKHFSSSPKRSRWLGLITT